MLSTVEVTIEAFVGELRDGYRRTWGGVEPEIPSIISWAASTALEVISQSDALYHDVDHTIHVTLVGQELLRGLHIRRGGVSPSDFLQVVVSLLCHDIGYVRGICRRDDGLVCATGNGRRVRDARGGRHRRGAHTLARREGPALRRGAVRPCPRIDVEAVKRNILGTRFPVPGTDEPCEPDGYPRLVRAADLIGQLSDPRYLKKIPALFHEFEETGVNRALGYRHPGDLRRNYPRFYWSCVHPHIAEMLDLLSLTERGLQVRANLFSNVFMVEHEPGVATGRPVGGSGVGPGPRGRPGPGGSRRRSRAPEPPGGP